MVNATRVLRRAADVVLGCCGLVVCLPTMAWLALAIKLTSPGPLLVGNRFRATSGSVVGRFIRRTSLDELPVFLFMIIGGATYFRERSAPTAVEKHYGFRVQRAQTAVDKHDGFRGRGAETGVEKHYGFRGRGAETGVDNTTGAPSRPQPVDGDLIPVMYATIVTWALAAAMVLAAMAIDVTGVALVGAVAGRLDLSGVRRRKAERRQLTTWLVGSSEVRRASPRRRLHGAAGPRR